MPILNRLTSCAKGRGRARDAGRASAFLMTSLLCLVARAEATAARPEADAQLVVAGDLVGFVRAGELNVHRHDADRPGQPPRLLLRVGQDDDGKSPILADDDLASARERARFRLDLPEASDDRDDVVDALDDELSLAQRRNEEAARRRPSAAGSDGPRPLVLMSSGRSLILFARSQILEFRDPGALRSGKPDAPVVRGFAPRGILVAGATTEGAIVAARASDLLLARPGGGFEPLSRLAYAPRFLAVDPAGAFIAVSDERRLDVYPLGKKNARRMSFRPNVRLRGLAACASGLFVLAEDGIHLVHARGHAEPRLTAPDLNRIGCDAGDGSVWAASDQRLHRLPEALAGSGRARLSSSRAVPAGAFAIASSGGELWWLGATGLPVRLLGPSQPSETIGRDRSAATAGRSLAGGPSPWRGLLPHVSIDGHARVWQRRRQVGAGIIAEWRLGARTPARGILLRAAAAAEPPPSPSPDSMEAPAVGTDDSRAPSRGEENHATQVGPDPDARCLAFARDRAVQRALVEPERAKSLLGRAGRAALLPEVRLRAERRSGRSESLDVKPSAAGDALGLDTDHDVRYEVRATWDLSRLVFSPDELGAASQSLRIADMRREIESQVNRLYFERRRLVVAAGATAPEEAATWQLRLEEIEADLDALAGGAFMRCRRALGKEVP